jgi:hypothetical protein
MIYITPDLYKKTKESKASDDLIINIAVILVLITQVISLKIREVS